MLHVVPERNAGWNTQGLSVVQGLQTSGARTHGTMIEVSILIWPAKGTSDFNQNEDPTILPRAIGAPACRGTFQNPFA